MEIDMHRVLTILSVCLLSTACVERTPELTPEERSQVEPFLATSAPSPEHELNVQFANGVRLLGYDASTERVTPGETFRVTWYWHAQENLTPGWNLFTHVGDSENSARLNQDAEGIVRRYYQPERWQAGQYIRDEQPITLPEEWGADEAILFVGLWKDDHRLAVRSGPSDGENRVRAASFEVSGGSAAAEPEAPEPPEPTLPAPPTLRVVQTADPIDIDGQLDEAAWNRTARTAAFVNPVSAEAASFRSGARALFDDDNLYVAFEVQDAFIQNTIDERDGHLWNQDAVEIFIDPDGNGRDYFEVQVSPTGQVFDTRFDAPHLPPQFGHVDWNAQVRAEVALRGTANDEEADQGYTVEIAIPWSSFTVDGTPVERPQPGASWRMNLFAVNLVGAAGTQFAAWSPIGGNDFHTPARFGRALFVNPPAPTAQAAPAPTTPEAQPTSPTKVAGTGAARLAAGARSRAAAQIAREANRLPRARP